MKNFISEIESQLNFEQTCQLHPTICNDNKLSLDAAKSHVVNIQRASCDWNRMVTIFLNLIRLRYS